tara:strand:+ start:683 stop:1453 length:771 start_codon:yes stop_codon:yes gene_type:complete
MAVDDSTAPKGIPVSGEVSPGNTGANRSINLLKNIKHGTGRTEINTSVNALRDWFKTYVGVTGNFSNASNTGQQVNFSDFHGTTILGVIATAVNETHSTYGTNNNAKVSLQGIFSDKYSYIFSMNGQIKIALNGSLVDLPGPKVVEFTGLQGGKDGQTGTEYTVTVQALKDEPGRSVLAAKNAQPEVQFRITPGYGGAAKVRGMNATGIGSFGDTTSINFTYASGAGKGKTSNALYLLQGKQDPSGRTYGPSMSYP